MSGAEFIQEQDDLEREQMERDDIFTACCLQFQKAEGISPSVRAGLLYRISEKARHLAQDCDPQFNSGDEHGHWG